MLHMYIFSKFLAQDNDFPAICVMEEEEDQLWSGL